MNVKALTCYKCRLASAESIRYFHVGHQQRLACKLDQGPRSYVAHVLSVRWLPRTVYVYTLTNIHIYIYTLLYIYTYMRTLPIYVCIYIYIYIDTYIHMCTCTYTYVYIYMLCVYLHLCIYICTAIIPKVLAYEVVQDFDQRHANTKGPALFVAARTT